MSNVGPCLTDGVFEVRVAAQSPLRRAVLNALPGAMLVERAGLQGWHVAGGGGWCDGGLDVDLTLEKLSALADRRGVVIIATSGTSEPDAPNAVDDDVDFRVVVRASVVPDIGPARLTIGAVVEGRDDCAPASVLEAILSGAFKVRARCRDPQLYRLPIKAGSPGSAVTTIDMGERWHTGDADFVARLWGPAAETAPETFVQRRLELFEVMADSDVKGLADRALRFELTDVLQPIAHVTVVVMLRGRGAEVLQDMIQPGCPG